jgi:anti-anti-sigma factor
VTAQRPHPRANRPFGVAVRPDSAELSGELDVTGVDELWAALDELVDSGCRLVTVDLADLDFLDAAGLGILVRAHCELVAAGGRLVLTGVRPAQHRLLEITGLDRVLAVRRPDPADPTS